MSADTVSGLLARLSSAQPDAAWREFLVRYSSLVMLIVRRHENDYERATECFIDVCAALSDDGFRRLRTFQSDGPARFETWLRAVVSNLCVDWRRKEQGRRRPPAGITRLPELEQQVYRCIYLRGMSRAQCLNVLRPRFPGLTEPQVAGINGRLFALLTPQQRWQLSMRTPESRPTLYGVPTEEDDSVWQLAEPGPGPDDLASEMQEQRLLREALAELPPEQRLLLRLRYEQDLTLVEVARLTRQPDPFRANRQIHAALQALADLMEARRSRSGRKNR